MMSGDKKYLCQWICSKQTMGLEQKQSSWILSIRKLWDGITFVHVSECSINLFLNNLNENSYKLHHSSFDNHSPRSFTQPKQLLYAFSLVAQRRASKDYAVCTYSTFIMMRTQKNSLLALVHYSTN